MTPEQYALFRKGKAKPAAGKPRVQKRRDELPENIIESQVVGFLRARGWRIDRQHVGVWVPYGQATKPARKRGKWRVTRIGETGQADWLAMRISRLRGKWDVFEFECKAPGARRTPEQVAYARRRQLEGGTWFGIQSNGKRYPGQPGNPVSGRKGEGGGWFSDEQEDGIRPDWRESGCVTRRYNSRSLARKAASAQIAKIPFELAAHKPPTGENA